jgi:transposase-like protein
MVTKNTSDFPTTLQNCIKHFSDEMVCINLLADIRWSDGKALCPNCGNGDATYFLAAQKRWKCRTCKKQFSVKFGTIFEDSPISLTKWFPAMWLICGAKNGISSYELGRAIGVTQKSAWFMNHRIRLAMKQGTFEKLGGGGETVEADETFVGGELKNMHEWRRKKHGSGKGGRGKAIVFGMLQRGDKETKSKVRAVVVPDRLKQTLQPIIKASVETGINFYTDDHKAYDDVTAMDYAHAFVVHTNEYVRGAIHTNGIENFWSLFKRGLKGTYVSVEPFHLSRYVDEQAFRFNTREGNDADRFLTALSEVVGKRVTYRKLTGKDEVGPSVNGEGSADQLQ